VAVRRTTKRTMMDMYMAIRRYRLFLRAWDTH
jgi:hypothetical protein